jgi:CENP-B N-terminal DNA-binding domain
MVYAAIRSALAVRLRITAHSASSALCGAPHKAEFERDLIRARTGEGRARAVARGQRMGRPPKLTPHRKREAIKRRDRGDEYLAEIGRSYNVSAATISRLR